MVRKTKKRKQIDTKQITTHCLLLVERFESFAFTFSGISISRNGYQSHEFHYPSYLRALLCFCVCAVPVESIRLNQNQHTNTHWRNEIEIEIELYNSIIPTGIEF